ncbi:hypothetical protein EP7_004821 [Isosphaeraceae bacterium EP7]
MPLDNPTPNGVLDLFRDEVTPREAEIGPEFDRLSAGLPAEGWAMPFPGIELIQVPDGPTLIRVTYRRLLAGGFDEVDRIRHELRELVNDIRAATPSSSQAEFCPPAMTHVDHAEGLEVICLARGIIRAS